MPASPDLKAADFSFPQSLLQPFPATLASAALVAPTTLITLVSGAAAIVNITPPQEGAHILIFLATGAWTMTAAGNIATAVAAAAVGNVVILVYNPANKKYYVGKTAL